jgi:hypothetical protein
MQSPQAKKMAGTVRPLEREPYGRRGWWFHEWEQGEDWERVRIDATMCPRISPAFLQAERRSLPRAVFDQEYCCVFHDTEDAVFRFDDVMACVHGEVVPFLQRRAACT